MEFAKAKAQGFGLLAAAVAPAAPQERAPALTERVKGVKLEKQEMDRSTAPDQQYGLYAIIGGSIAGGIVWELAQLWLRRRRTI